jgi:hypothetical protein
MHKYENRLHRSFPPPPPPPESGWKDRELLFLKIVGGIVTVLVAGILLKDIVKEVRD